VAGIDLSGTSANPIPNLNTLTNSTWYWKLKTPADLTEWEFSLGLQYSAVGTSWTDSGFFIAYSNNTGCTVPGSDSGFQYLTRSVGATTTAGTGPTPQANTWYWAKIYITTAGTVNFQMKADGGSWTPPASSNSNIYYGYGIPHIKHGTCNSTGKSLKIDEFRYYRTGVN
jgi:hypothetical protein